MPHKGRYYKVEALGNWYRGKGYLSEVRGGTVVKALEGAPKGTWDVVDVQLKDGDVRSVYSFQLDKPIKKPKNWK